MVVSMIGLILPLRQNPLVQQVGQTTKNHTKISIFFETNTIFSTPFHPLPTTTQKGLNKTKTQPLNPKKVFAFGRSTFNN